MATLTDLSNLPINIDPYTYDTTYSGLVYAFYATGGFTMDQCFNTIKLLPAATLYQYDVTQALQVAFDVRTMNAKLGLYKDNNNQYITSSMFDEVSDSFPNDSITLTADEFVIGMTSPQVISVGTYSSMYSDYTEYVNTYFGYTGGFSSLFASASEFNVNGGIFGSNELIYLLNPSSDPSGANVKAVTGSITISNINQLLRYAVDSNVFNNRTPGYANITGNNDTTTVEPGSTLDNTNNALSSTPGNGTASDISGNVEGPLQNLYKSNYGTADGFVAGDLLYVPTGTTIKLHLVIDAELYNPLNNTGSTNILNLISTQDFTSKYGTSSAEFFTGKSTASITNIDRTLTAPLLIKLANLSTTSSRLYNNLYIDSNGNPTNIYPSANSNNQNTNGNTNNSGTTTEPPTQPNTEPNPEPPTQSQDGTTETQDGTTETEDGIYVPPNDPDDETTENQGDNTEPQG
jgi:hypothetical protein